MGGMKSLSCVVLNVPVGCLRSRKNGCDGLKNIQPCQRMGAVKVGKQKMMTNFTSTGIEVSTLNQISDILFFIPQGFIR